MINRRATVNAVQSGCKSQPNSFINFFFVYLCMDLWSKRGLDLMEIWVIKIEFSPMSTMIKTPSSKELWREETGIELRISSLWATTGALMKLKHPDSEEEVVPVSQLVSSIHSCQRFQMEGKYIYQYFNPIIIDRFDCEPYTLDIWN